MDLGKCTVNINVIANCKWKYYQFFTRGKSADSQYYPLTRLALKEDTC